MSSQAECRGCQGLVCSSQLCELNFPTLPCLPHAVYAATCSLPRFHRPSFCVCLPVLECVFAALYSVLCFNVPACLPSLHLCQRLSQLLQHLLPAPIALWQQHPHKSHLGGQIDRSLHRARVSPCHWGACLACKQQKGPPCTLLSTIRTQQRPDATLMQR